MAECPGEGSIDAIYHVEHKYNYVVTNEVTQKHVSIDRTRNVRRL